MKSGRGVELKERWVVLEETAKLVEESWKVGFVDAFVHQFRKRVLDRVFWAQFTSFCLLRANLLKG
jgi:hypothetical protein